MPPNSEIEKLERRWRENPKGTVFAPYAEVLRKNGDHELAKDILRQGLELHPDHIPGNIVLGRCSIDLGEDGPAEQAFTHVLGLDAENVIALQALADITERHGRLAEARDWLGKLVAVDPSNDVARDQIARVEAAQQAAAAVMSATASVQVEPEAEEKEVTIEIIPPPLPSTVKTREIEAFARPKDGPLAEPDRSETGGGVIRDAEPARIVDDADAAFDALVPPPIGHVIDASTARTVELEPLMPPEPAPIADLEPVELDIASAARSLAAAPLADIEIREEFAAPSAEPEAPSSFGYRPEERGEAIELRSSGLTEFQAPDASNELLDLKPADRSEFQAPDAANELLEIKPADRSEFQAPDASNELLDITPAPHSEFQAPDASHELLDLAPSGSSEFQEPDASQELAALTGSASSEYQTPSGSEDLLALARAAEARHEDFAAAEPVADPVADEPEPFAMADAEDGPSLIADLEALSTAPTEEMATALLPAIEEPAASATDAPEAVDLTEPVRAEEEIAPIPAAPDWLFDESGEHAAAEAPPVDEPAEADLDAVEPVAAISERIADAYAEAEFEEPHLPGDLDDDLAAPLEEESRTEVASGRISEEKGSSDLKLIFPDDAAQPEPHQVRRITQEVELPAMAGDLDERDPEPILTESMAELYARQGHTVEALKVYRALAERAPHDTRLRERIAELEIRTPQPQRRMTYVALETGGESVESFFRALADSRPGGHGAVHATGQISDDDGSGAPTRPARDPLSLSAIFGEDPAAAKPAATPVAPATGTGADAFSFDQFFGSGGNGGGQAAARPENPAGEDLDQFQHWLKSLKK
jgi:hypothetical protein